MKSHSANQMAHSIIDKECYCSMLSSVRYCELLLCRQTVASGMQVEKKELLTGHVNPAWAQYVG